ncbi:hypothetical protein EXU48_06060 [Occultella glacieicola]|uniref:P/Homo B domain-containing protein n=1 Tax=Occultella glacieicola TaxID=2518684 RepID=A0ABY2E5T9_9MICO|nr:hypothetical protein [Occultella glacieicola]TDE95824.1 hypothetical protein EXU48_06060 [Occultella glacieicola]
MHGSRRRARVELLVLGALAAAVGATATADPAIADGPTTFTSSDGPILVPAAQLELDYQPAAPFPSVITVSGLDGPVVDVSVTLQGISHEFFGDADVLLESPSGDNLVVLSDTLGYANDLTFTLTDAATEPVPDILDPAGSYLPTDVDVIPPVEDIFSPGPDPSEHTTFADAFAGTDPNGSWSLYVIDDTGFDSGSLAGWSLTITTASVDAGGPYAIDEGSPLTLAATTDLPGATLTWDLDGDGGFDDATGATPTLDAAALEGLGLADGPATATFAVSATDGVLTVTDTADVTVINVAPTVTVSAPATVGLNEPFLVTVTIDDPSVADRDAGFGALVGVYADLQATCSPPVDPADRPADVTNPLEFDATAGTAELEFTLTSGDPYAAWVEVTDSDGATSAACTTWLVLEDPGPTAEPATPPATNEAAATNGGPSATPQARSGGDDDLAATGSPAALLGAVALGLVAAGLALRRRAKTSHRHDPAA